MRTTFLTRSAVAVASLAIGSVALTAAPASADASSATRGDVIKVIANYTGFGSSTGPATQALLEKVCDVDSETGRDVEVSFTRDEDEVTGFVVQALLVPESGPSRTCTFAAFVPYEAYSTMSGTANITLQDQSDVDLRAVAPNHDFTLSGDVFVTPPVDDIGYGDGVVATATGELLKVQAATTTSKRVSNPKSTKFKNAALKTYKRTVKAAQKKLKKSLAKAGNSSSKKSAARATYKARKKAAKAKLHIAWSSDKKTIVTQVPSRTTRTPFSISTEQRFSFPNQD